MINKKNHEIMLGAMLMGQISDPTFHPNKRRKEFDFDHLNFEGNPDLKPNRKRNKPNTFKKKKKAKAPFTWAKLNNNKS